MYNENISDGIAPELRKIGAKGVKHVKRKEQGVGPGACCLKCSKLGHFKLSGARFKTIGFFHFPSQREKALGLGMLNPSGFQGIHYIFKSYN